MKTTARTSAGVNTRSIAVRSDKATRKDHYRRDEKCDLNTAADCDSEHQIHSVFCRHHHRSRVFGCIANNCDDDHTNEDAGKAEVVRCLLHRADEEFAHPCNQSSGPGEDRDRLADGP